MLFVFWHDKPENRLVDTLKYSLNKQSSVRVNKTTRNLGVHYFYTHAAEKKISVTSAFIDMFSCEMPLG